MTRSLNWSCGVLVLVLVAACASGGSATTDAGIGRDAAPHHDAPIGGGDAPVHTDARPLDAFVPKDAPPDAPEDDGFCPDGVNSECPASGTCCFVAVCVAGTAIGDDLCIPN